MSKNRNRNPVNRGWWQTEGLNNASFIMYRQQIMQMAMSRFRWVLPPECNARFLEFTLLNDSMATIAAPVKKDSDGNLLPKVFYTLQVGEQGKLNMYGEPATWGALGANGQTHFSVSPASGVIVYDNTMRISMFQMINYYAAMLTRADVCYRQNLSAQNLSWIFKTDPNHYAAAVNMFKQVQGGEPAVFTTNAFDDVVSTDVLQTGVQFIGESLQMTKTNIWNEVFQCLGINCLTRKGERMIEDEVTAENDPTEIMKMAALDARRDACDYLNAHFDLGVEVYWNQDNESENYNLLHNIKDQMEEGVTDGGVQPGAVPDGGMV